MLGKSFTHAKPPLDYKIIQGFPVEVEKEIKSLLTIGWELGSEMYTMKPPGEDVDIVVQCVVLYEK